jgi:NADH-quinone oxidoreductase subunit J
MAIGQIILFGILALMVVGTAIGLLVSRSAVYAALYLVLNFIAVGLLYLVLGAPFIALAQVTVYAGSIMVLFLFVIMLLGAENLPNTEPLRGQRFLGILLAVAFLAEVTLYFLLRGSTSPIIAEPSLSFSTPATLGMLLFNQYLLPFEVTGVILLTATVGAIILTHSDKPARPAAGEEPKE